MFKTNCNKTRTQKFSAYKLHFFVHKLYLFITLKSPQERDSANCRQRRAFYAIFTHKCGNYRAPGLQTARKHSEPEADGTGDQASNKTAPVFLR